MGNLKERIAALQQRSVSAPQQSSQSTSKPSSPTSGGTSSLRSKIAKFESKGGIPIPRGSFGLGAPPESGQNASRELYGNRIPGVNRPSVPVSPVSRSGSPLPPVDGSIGVSAVRTRRLSAGAVEGPSTTSVDLNGVLQKLAIQRNLDILNGIHTDVSSTQSPSDKTSIDNLITAARRRSGRRSASVDMLSRNCTKPESDDIKQTAPSIIISSEPSSVSPDIFEGSQIVDDPVESLPGSNRVTASRSKSASPSSPKAPSPTVDSATLVISASPTSTSDVVSNAGKIGLEHPPDSPYLEFAKTSLPPTSSPTNMEAPIRKVTSPTRSRTKPDVPNVSRPTRSSSLAPAPRPSRSPSPTPSMIHRPEAGSTEAAAASLLVTANKSRQSAHVRRTITGLPANPPPVPDNEGANISYGSVTLGSHSETNLLDSVQKNKLAFSAVVHQKVTEKPAFLPSSNISSVRSVPDLQSYAQQTIGLNAFVPPGSPGHGDLEALLAEAALLEERLKQGENGIDNDSDRLQGSDSDTSQLGTSSVPVIATPEPYDDETYDQVPPPPPPKGFPRMLSSFKKLTSAATLRSATGSHSRVSTSGSEMSSEDSASLGTPSDNGVSFPISHSNGSIDRPSSRGSSALGFGYPSSVSSKKNLSSISRASSFAEKIWHRGRTKSNNSSNERQQSSSPRKNAQLPISKLSRSHTQPPTLPLILPVDNDLANHRPVSWQSQSSTASTNTTSTVSPANLFTEELFDAFPSVPQEVPSPGPGATTFPRMSHDVARSASLPLRTRRHSVQKFA